MSVKSGVRAGVMAYLFFRECCFRVRVRVRVRLGLFSLRVRLGLFRVRVRVSVNSDQTKSDDRVM